MAKITIDDITSSFASVTQLNAYFQQLEDELNDKVLYRNNPDGEPNTMENDLDMNSNDLLNVDNIQTQMITLGGQMFDIASVSGVLPPQTGHAGEFLKSDGAASDWAAILGTDVSFTPTGNIAAADLQAAIVELDNEKAASSHTHVEADITDLDKYTQAQVDSGFVDQDSDTGAASLPTGTSAQRPGTPVEGMFRRNTDTGQFEGYTGSAWSGVGGASGGAGNPFVYQHDHTVTADHTIPGTQNAISGGPMTINTGVTITVATGATWTIVGG